MNFDYFGLSDIGKVRARNEDFWQVNLDSRAVAIADGMGGCAGGDVASYEAISTFMHMIDAYRSQIDNYQGDRYQELLKSMLSEVNALIYEHGMMESHLHGMGTTLSFMQFLQDRAWLLHVGDSRIYRLRDTTLSCLTEDHSLANQLINRYGLPKQSDKVYPYRHVLTNVLGSRPHVSPDIRDISYEKDDLFVFCSDGLTNLVSDLDIRDVLLQTTDLEESGNSLISLANNNGGSDNVTVVLVRIQ